MLCFNMTMDSSNGCNKLDLILSPFLFQSHLGSQYSLSSFIQLHYFAFGSIELLRELCCSTTQVERRHCLRSAAQAELIVQRSRTATRQRRAFSVAGPETWNGLPVTLPKIPIDRSISFLSALKTVMFDRGWAGSASE